MRVLVTGGVRSGKSAHAEALLAGSAGVSYVAPGPLADPVADPDWADRVAAHRARRPPSWTTVETRDLAGALRAAPGDVLVDCLGTWVTGVLDEQDGWELSSDAARDLVGAHLEEVGVVLRALAEADRTVVLVTNEVGLGVVPAHRSGRLFRDLLGTANQQVAAACDEVHLVVAGRVLRL